MPLSCVISCVSQIEKMPYKNTSNMPRCFGSDVQQFSGFQIISSSTPYFMVVFNLMLI